MSGAAPGGKRKPVPPAAPAVDALKRTASKRRQASTPVAYPAAPSPQEEAPLDEDEEKRQKRCVCHSCGAGPSRLSGCVCATAYRLLRNRQSAHQHREKQRLYKNELEAFNRTLMQECDHLR